jgi:hypothetical protein
MKPILAIFEQVDPPPQPYNRFRILETMVTVDGYRTRVVEKGYATFEEAQHATKDTREKAELPQRPGYLTVFGDGPQGSGITRLAQAICSEATMWDALPPFEIVDMSEVRDGGKDEPR